MLKTKYQHIHFVKTKCKHMPYTIHLNKGYFCVGTVEYHKPWKKFATNLEKDYVHDENCHRDMADFLDQLNEKLKTERAKNANKKSVTSSE